jgi:hypothetical protein
MVFHLTTAQRSANAKKAAATRKAHGVKAFGGHAHHGFHLTPAQRIVAARKAAVTRRAKRSI